MFQPINFLVYRVRPRDNDASQTAKLFNNKAPPPPPIYKYKNILNEISVPCRKCPTKSQITPSFGGMGCVFLKLIIVGFYFGSETGFELTKITSDSPENCGKVKVQIIQENCKNIVKSSFKCQLFFKFSLKFNITYFLSPFLGAINCVRSRI